MTPTTTIDRADLQAHWFELHRFSDLLRFHIDNHNGASQDSQDRLLTVSEATLARLDTFLTFLDAEFADG